VQARVLRQMSRHAWWLSVAMEVTVLVTAITTYVRAGEDSDEGALAGSRADERQKMLSLRSRALGWNFATVASFIGHPARSPASG